MGDLELDTAVVGSDGSYVAQVSSDWRIWGPMGGYAASIALRAAAAEAPTHMVPTSFTCQFLRPADFRQVELRVEHRRTTRNTAALRVEMSQDGRAVLDAQVWFAVESEQLAHDSAGLPPVPGPDACLDIVDLVPDDEEPPFPFWENYDVRVVEWIPRTEWPLREPSEPRFREWLRLRPSATFEDPVLEACRVLIAADLPSWPAMVRAYTGELPYVAPNLDLSVQFTRPPNGSGWLLTDGFVPVADRGFAGFRSQVWADDGRLLASGSGQLLCRPLPSA